MGDDERGRLIERAREVIGAFRSGSSGTSERHDEALDDAFASS